MTESSYYGLFWPTSQSRHRHAVPGQLKVAPTGKLSLTLFSPHYDARPPWFIPLPGDPVERSVSGEISGLGAITIFRCVTGSHTLSFGLDQIIVAEMLCGDGAVTRVAANCHTSLRLKNFTLPVPELSLWRGIPWVRPDEHRPRNEYGFTVTLPESIRAQVQRNEHLTIDYRYEPQGGGASDDRFSIRCTPAVTLAAAHGLDIDCALQRIHAIKAFFIFLLDSPITESYLLCTIEQLALRPSVWMRDLQHNRCELLLTPFQYNYRERKRNLHDVLLFESEIVSNFSQMLEQWLQVYTTAPEAIVQFLDAVHSEDYRLNIKFLLLTQAFDALHRTKTKEQDKAFRVRLNDCLASYPSLFGDQAARLDLIDQIVHTRNRYTHGSERRPEFEAGDAELFPLARKMEAIIMVYLLDWLLPDNHQWPTLIKQRRPFKARINPT